jgi:hypothetical protein
MARPTVSRIPVYSKTSYEPSPAIARISIRTVTFYVEDGVMVGPSRHVRPKRSDATVLCRPNACYLISTASRDVASILLYFQSVRIRSNGLNRTVWNQRLFLKPMITEMNNLAMIFFAPDHRHGYNGVVSISPIIPRQHCSHFGMNVSLS